MRNEREPIFVMECSNEMRLRCTSFGVFGPITGDSLLLMGGVPDEVPAKLRQPNSGEAIAMTMTNGYEVWRLLTMAKFLHY